MWTVKKYPQCRRALYSLKLELLPNNTEGIGRLLEALCLFNEQLVVEDMDRAEAALLHWIDCFQVTYVQLVEAKMNSRLLGIKRRASGAAGAFARSSMLDR